MYLILQGETSMATSWTILRRAQEVNRHYRPLFMVQKSTGKPWGLLRFLSRKGKHSVISGWSLLDGIWCHKASSIKAPFRELTWTPSSVQQTEEVKYTAYLYAKHKPTRRKRTKRQIHAPTTARRSVWWVPSRCSLVPFKWTPNHLHIWRWSTL